jgi:predicted cobalt transporter CbtA
MCMSILFILLVSLFTASAKGIGKSGLWGSGGFASYGMDASLVVDRALLAPKKPGAIFSERENDWISTWVTRLFIAIVLISAIIYLVSQCPGFQSPFWLGFVLQGFTYGSAYLFYVSGGDESTGN